MAGIGNKLTSFKHSKFKYKTKQVVASGAVLAILIGGVAMFVGQHAIAESLNKTIADSRLNQPKVTQGLVNQGSNFRLQLLSGHVTKQLEQFSFTTDEGAQYHVYDPNQILDKLAKQRHIDAKLYEMDAVKVKAMVSEVGHYGHMGYYEQQITILGIGE